MDHWIACSAARPILRRVAVMTMTTLLVVATVSGAVAQTLTQPNSRTQSPLSRNNAKSSSTARVKSCSTYGPGFVNVPGTDACIKIGGSVDAEGMSSSGH